METTSVGNGVGVGGIGVGVVPGMKVAVGVAVPTGVLVARTGVLVAETGVFVAGTGVFVPGPVVAVGVAGTAVDGIVGVLVAGADVLVGTIEGVMEGRKVGGAR